MRNTYVHFCACGGGETPTGWAWLDGGDPHVHGNVVPWLPL